MARRKIKATRGKVLAPGMRAARRCQSEEQKAANHANCLRRNAKANERGLTPTGKPRHDTRGGLPVLCPRDIKTGRLKAGDPYQVNENGVKFFFYAP